MSIAVVLWNNRVAPVFDAATEVAIYSCKTSCILTNTISLAGLTLQEKITLLKESDVTTLICGALPFRYEPLFAQASIDLSIFIKGDVEEVIAAYIQGNLTDASFTMPGCKGRIRGKQRRISQPSNKGATMPNLNGTGPQGKGPRTGGGRGRCATPKNEEVSRPLSRRERQARIRATLDKSYCESPLQGKVK